MTTKLYHSNLRGADFNGQDLTGQNFSKSDIRGANFSKAILIGANFSHVKAGLSIVWSIELILAVIAISLLGGLIAGYSSGLFIYIWIKHSEGFVFGTIALVSVISLLAIALLKGTGGFLATSAEIVAACLIAVIAFIPYSQTDFAVDAQFTALVIVGSIASAGNTAVGIAIARLIPLWNPKFLISFVAIFGILTGILLGDPQGLEYLFAIPFALISIATGEIIGWLAISGKKKYRLIYSLSMNLVIKGGTNFSEANLTDVDFTQASLRSANFRDAILIRVNWFKAKALEHSCTEGSYLDEPMIRDLVVTKNGCNENFNQFNLRELNLQDANLSDISLIGADLSKANLQNANLSRAKLVQTQLYHTNLHGACLTGAYIQDWSISTDTKLEQVDCDYVYMRLPTQENPEPWRKPDNGKENFKQGDFADFIAPIIKTLDLYRQQNVDPRKMATAFKSLDLYHYGGIDPAAAAIAFKQIAEENPQAGLEMVALEGRGQDKIRLQAAVTGDADSSQLNAQYFEKYREISSLPYSDIQSLLAGMVEKDDHIRSLEKLLGNALEQPKFYIETYQNQGEFIMSQSKGNVNISGVQGNIIGIAAAGENQSMTGVAIGAISGSVTNTINQLPASVDPNNLGIKELLTQLQAAIESEPELPDEDKVEALEQVKTLAEAGQNPEDNVLQKVAKTSMKILKGTVASLPDTAKLAESCVKLLPAIMALLTLV